MVDETGQVVATAFPSLAGYVKMFAEEDVERQQPQYYQDHPERVDKLAVALQACPFTVLLAFDENTIKGKIEFSVKAIAPTFNPDPAQLRHPLKQILRSTSNLMASSGCPPCALHKTSFDSGAGVTCVPGGSALQFRALLVIVDKEASLERVADTEDKPDDPAPALRCTRKVQCLCRPDDDNTTYDVTSMGALSFAHLWSQPRKNEVLHTLLSWRGENDLTLVAFFPVAQTIDQAAAFKKFFAREVELKSQYLDTPEASDIRFTSENTPTKRLAAALTTGDELVPTEAWVKRARLTPQIS